VGGEAVSGWLRRLFRGAPDARAAFRANQSALLKVFQQAAAASGRPRGLIWVEVTLSGEPVFVRERGTRHLVALLPATVRFEPEAGSDLEDVPQARESRPVVALFTFDGRAWQTVGRAVFNLSPAQVIERSAGRFEIIDTSYKT
jgi:hypothetical protein